MPGEEVIVGLYFPAQINQGGAPTAAIGSRQSERGDMGTFFQYGMHGSSQCTGALTVDYADLMDAFFQTKL